MQTTGSSGDVDPLVEALLAQEGVELYTYLTEIRHQRCANCGDPASVVRRSLEDQERQFFCESCGRFV